MTGAELFNLAGTFAVGGALAFAVFLLIALAAAHSPTGASHAKESFARVCLVTSILSLVGSGVLALAALAVG